MIQNIEQTLVANLMWNRSSEFLDVTEGLSCECFTDPKCATLFEAMRLKAERGEPIDDPILLAEEIKKLKPSETLEPSGTLKPSGTLEPSGTFLPSMDAFEIAQFTVDSSPLLDTRAYVEMVIDSHERRKLENVLMQMVGRCRDACIPIMETMSAAVSQITSATMAMPHESVTLGESIDCLMRRVDDNISGKKKDGMPTGLTGLDGYGGLHSGNLVILAAESSQGKTALALTIVRNATELSGAKAVVYSMEMSAEQLTARLVSRDAHMPASVIMYRPLKEGALGELDQSIGRLNGITENIFFDEDAVSSLQKIQASIRLHVARHGVKLVVVDYLQIINLQLRDTHGHELALAEAARSLQRLAKELDICIVLLSQLSRDNMSHVPTVDRLRGSGQINEAADLTLLIYRPEVFGLSYPGDRSNIDTKGTAMLRIAKDRHGAYGGVRDFFVGFQAQTTTFYDLTTLPVIN